MSEELKLNDRLAIDRTRLAAERSLMAWIRTALSMIAFGFTIYKFLQAMHAQSPVPVLRPNAPRNVGLLLVGIGTFAVAIACIQHWNYVRKLSPDLQVGCGVHCGDLNRAAWHPNLREHGLHQRALRLNSEDDMAGLTSNPSATTGRHVAVRDIFGAARGGSIEAKDAA
jgi:uncharacterized membrane protein YidH (DUF202 family)